MDITIPAFIMVIRNRPITHKLIFHTDLVIQYACDEFKDLLERYTLLEHIMSRKGNCWDNAVAVCFFKSLKVVCTGVSIQLQNKDCSRGIHRRVHGN